MGDPWQGARPRHREFQAARPFDGVRAIQPQQSEHHDHPHVPRGNIGRAKVYAKVLNGSVWFLAGWSFFFATPSAEFYAPLMALLLLMPWLAFAVMGIAPDHFSLIGQRNDPRPRLDGALVMPGILGVLRAITDIHLVEWTGVNLAAAACTLVMGFIALKLSPHMLQSKMAVFCLILLLVPYGYSSVLIANAIADRGEPQVFRVVVKDKYISRGTKSALAEINIGPWGPRTEATKGLPVSSDVFRVLNRGGEACIDLMPGFLGIQWYRVRGCGS